MSNLEALAQVRAFVLELKFLSFGTTIITTY